MLQARNEIEVFKWKLGYCYLTEADCSFMAKGLSNLNSVKDLELVFYKCDLRDDGFTRILGAISDRPQKIEKLYLNFARNEVGDPVLGVLSKI